MSSALSDLLVSVLARATARGATAADPHAGLPDPGELIDRIPDLDLQDTASDEPSPEDKIAIARRAEAAALAVDPRIQNSEGAEYADRRARYVYATSSGFTGSYATSSF